MPKSVIQYSLLISCPGDIKEEINCVEECVTQINTLYSDALGIEIVTKHWRKSSYAQSGGKPQALLNEQFVNDCDAAVAILWTRFGTPTDEYGSGTEEEVEIMLSSGKQVFMYFSDKPLSPSQMNEESYKKVQAFREKYKDRGIYFTYSSDEEFKTLFFAHLSQFFLSEKRVAEVKGERHSELKMLPTHQRYLGGEAIQPAASLPALRRQGLPILLLVQRRNAQHDCHTTEEAQIPGDTGQMQIEIPLPAIFFRRRIFPGIFPCVGPHEFKIAPGHTDVPLVLQQPVLQRLLVIFGSQPKGTHTLFGA